MKEEENDTVIAFFTLTNDPKAKREGRQRSEGFQIFVHVGVGLLIINWDY